MPDISDQPTLPTLTRGKTAYLPDKIGPYKIESLFKKGGMSFLYLGLDKETQKPIIIKVLSPKYIQNKEMVDRFLKEAEIIRLSDHPNIVRLYGQGTWEKGLYIAMEFIQGISLKQFLLERSLSLKKALEIVLQVGYALCHLHAHRVIHRDIKPENILITETGEIKVIDFGIAQLLKKETNERITIKKRFMGTPSYMSPEQKEDPKKVSFASDIFSLGVIAYELILGKLSHGIIHLSLIPKNLRKILDRALKIEAEERYQDIVDLVTDISEYLKNFEELEEAREEEKLDTIYSSLKKSEDLLITQKTVDKKPFDIFIAKEESLSLSGIYLDFFQLSDNIFAILQAKAIKKDLESFMHLSIFRGYAKMAFADAKTNKEFLYKPSFILNKLNSALSQDEMEEKFQVNLSILNLNTNELIHSSAGSNLALHIDTNTQKITNLKTTGHILAESIDFTYDDSVLNFNVGDKIILFSKQINLKSEELNKLILENILFSAENQANILLNNFKSFTDKKDKTPFLVVCLFRNQ